MNWKTVFFGNLGNGVNVILADRSTITDIVAVLKTNELRLWEMYIVRSNSSFYFVQINSTVIVIIKDPRVNTPEGRNTASFIHVGVGLVTKNHFRSSIAMSQYRDQICHGSTGNKECFLLTENTRCFFLKCIYGRVFFKHIVSQFSHNHSLSH